MTIRNLDAAFAPNSVALIGASERVGSVGAVVLDNIIAGGFGGPIYPVNPKYGSLRGLKTYRRIADLPAAPDLAVIMTPPGAVVASIAELAARGCRAAVVITAGLGDDAQAAMLTAARPSLMRILGPNTIGLIAPHARLNASFVHLNPQPGGLALVSQSGAIVSSLIDWAAAEGLGFSHIVSVGDMADVDVGDVLNWLAGDPYTTAVLLYLETITEGRKFMSAARAAARLKPVIAVKPGRHAAAARAALSHTGGRSNQDAVVEGALLRAGIIRVDDLEDLFTSAEICARFKPLTSGRVAIVTNGGGAGVLAVDQLLDRGATLAEFSDETLRRLDRALPSTWSGGNPVDIIGDASPQRYRESLLAVADDPAVDAILAMNCPTALAAPAAVAEAVVAEISNGLINGKPVLAAWLGRQTAQLGRQILERAGVATFDTPAQAAAAVVLLTRWSTLRGTLEQVPLTAQVPDADRDAARAILTQAAAAGRSLLTEPEAQAFLAAYGVPVPETIVVPDEAGVGAAAQHLLTRHGGVVVKIVSPQVTRKLDVGGVALGLRSRAAAVTAARRMRTRLRRIAGAELAGFAVAAMVERPLAEAMLVEIGNDPVFGTIVTVGSGGLSFDVDPDLATGLVPLDDVLAGHLLDRTRVAHRLAGHRGRPAADRAAILRTIVAVSQMAVDFPAIRRLAINPLIAGAAGVVALDVHIDIDPARVSEAGPGPDLAIRPYPEGWTRLVDARNGLVLLRPVRPADVRLFPAFLARVERDDLRLRFMSQIRTLSEAMLVRLTQLDYDREIAFAAFDPASQQILGISRFAADPDREVGEFAILVRSDMQGSGVGRLLMEQLIAFARAEGLQRLEGIMLRENDKMIAFSRSLGFMVRTDPDDTTQMRAVLDLQASSP